MSRNQRPPIATAHQSGSLLEVTTREGAPTLICTVAGQPALCKSCEAVILWVTTPRGSRMPVDLPDDDSTTTTSHFATCPDAAEWRR